MIHAITTEERFESATLKSFQAGGLENFQLVDFKNCSSAMALTKPKTAC
jgi:hypothetical protein